MDERFGKMRQAGLSASRMNSARSLYVPSGLGAEFTELAESSNEFSGLAVEE